MQNELMPIGEMCNSFDVTPRALRFYEAKELLFPVHRGNRRFFTRSDRARLKLILRGKRFGFSLEEIRGFLNLYYLENGAFRQLDAVMTAASSQLRGMIAHRAELDTLIDDLRDEMSRVHEMIEQYSKAPDE